MVKMPVNLGFGTTIDRFKTDASKPLVKQKTSLRVPSPFSRCKKTKPVSLWKRQQETEQYIQDLHFNPVIAQKLRIKRSVGPGYYDLNLSTLKETNMPEGAVFGTSKRSIMATSYKTPGPSTYFPKILDRSFVLKKYFGNKSLFGEPYRWAKNKYENNTIPPNRYRHTCGIDELLKKRVSKKGPYQTFTGPRDHTTIRNHFAPTHSLGDHFYIGLNSDLDFLLNHPSKKNYGVVYRTPIRAPTEYCDRLHDHTSTCVIEKDTPGPCSYDITQHTIKAAKASKIPFNSTTKQWRYRLPIDKFGPGPGRYFLDGFNLDSSCTLTPNQRRARIKAKYKAYSPYGECEPSTTSTKSRPYLKARKRIKELKRKYYKALLARVEELAARKADISYPVKEADKLIPIESKRDVWVFGPDPKAIAPVRTIEKILAEHTAVRNVSIQNIENGHKLDYLYISVTVDPDSSINSNQLANYYRKRTNRKLALPLKIVKEVVEKSIFESQSKDMVRDCFYQYNLHEADFLLQQTDSSYRPWKGLIKLSSDTRPHWTRSLNLPDDTEEKNESELLDESDSTKEPSIEFIKQSGSTKNPWKGLIKRSSSTRPHWNRYLKLLGSTKQKSSQVVNQPGSTEQTSDNLINQPSSTEQLSDNLINQPSSTKQSSKRVIKQSSSTRPPFNHSLRRLGSSKQKSSKVFIHPSGTKLSTSEFRSQSKNITNFTKHPWQELIKRSSSTKLSWDHSLKRLGSNKQPSRAIVKHSSSIRQLWHGHLKQTSSTELNENGVLSRASTPELPLHEFSEQPKDIKYPSSRYIKRF